MKRVFIDGSAGTTGLRLRERLAGRTDITLHILAEEDRKDPAKRKEAIAAADLAFLCLPDDAAKEAAAFARDADTVIIDTSTAHRTEEGWVYGFPEIAKQREKIASAKRIANPGCHASGFIALVAPLVEGGLLDADQNLTAFSITGYSGGGKKMIASYEEPDRDPLLDSPRQYGLSQMHKHLPEMQKYTGLTKAPVFSPIVADYYAGMEVTVPLAKEQLGGTIDDVKTCLQSYYKNGLVRVLTDPEESGFLAGNAMAGRDDMILRVEGSAERILLIALFDNLGKGASGAAIQNMNLVFGLEEAEGLVVKNA